MSSPAFSPLVGATAAHLGWQVTYLGASLPAAEIAGAAVQKRARAVALSLVYPEDDPRLPGELTRLREALPAAMTLLVIGFDSEASWNTVSASTRSALPRRRLPKPWV